MENRVCIGANRRSPVHLTSVTPAPVSLGVAAGTVVTSEGKSLPVSNLSVQNNAFINLPSDVLKMVLSHLGNQDLRSIRLAHSKFTKNESLDKHVFTCFFALKFGYAVTDSNIKSKSVYHDSKKASRAVKIADVLANRYPATKVVSVDCQAISPKMVDAITAKFSDLLEITFDTTNPFAEQYTSEEIEASLKALCVKNPRLRSLKFAVGEVLTNIDFLPSTLVKLNMCCASYPLNVTEMLVKEHGNLQELSMSGNAPTDEASLSNLCLLKELRSLTYRFCRINFRKEFIPQFLTRDNFPKLVKVDFRGTVKDRSFDPVIDRTVKMLNASNA